MDLKVGSRVRSAVCTTEALIVRSPEGDVDLRCGGHPMVPREADAAGGGSVDPAYAGGSLIGKRYADEGLGIEVLVTKGGSGSIAVGTTTLAIRDAKPLPSSD